MKRRSARLIMGSALGLAAIGVAIDHTRHRLPAPQPAAGEAAGRYAGDTNPCGLGGDNPCGLGGGASSGLAENPCSLGNENPCSL